MHKDMAWILIGTLVTVFILPARFFSFAFAEDHEYARGGKQKSSVAADVSDISGTKYFPRVYDSLHEANESIVCVLYLVSFNPKDKDSSVFKLVNELVYAHQRGVQVRVILDQNIDFSKGIKRDQWETEGKNVNCYNFLKENGVDVVYDDAARLTHSKLIIIDTETVIVGSSNWTASALDHNYESNVLISSKELAKTLLADVKDIDAQESRAPFGSTVVISWDFLRDKSLLNQMVHSHDERAFDIYLYLLKEYDGNDQKRVAVIYDHLSNELGMFDMTKVDYRRQINKVLRKFQG